MKISFIGLGNMATAMIGGILQKEILLPDEIIGTNRSAQKAEKLRQEYGIQIAESNQKAAAAADIIFLSVKPQFYAEVIAQIKDEVSPDSIVVSIAPGKTLAWLAEQFGRDVKLVRCMPNTPALVGEGCTGVCCNERVQEKEQKMVLELLGSFGRASLVTEPMIDVVVGVSGSAPAYVFLFIEAMADEAVAEGMPRAQAYEFAAQAVLGSAKMVLETGKHPGELKDMVCSPGGTTIRAVKKLEEKGLRSAVMEAMQCCIDRSRSM